jgi:LacI family transcriptional regulator
MAANIRDVARESGVSTATVSYVINDGPRAVHPETRARVLAAMERLQYYPSSAARGLNRKRAECIGVVLPRPDPTLIVNPYFGSVLHGIVREATTRQQNITLLTGLFWKGARESLPAFRDPRVDGYVLIAPVTNSDIVEALAQAGVPCVAVNADSTEPRAATLDVDNRAAARLAVEHLLALGHERIAMLNGRENSWSARPRRDGWRDALEAAGIAPDLELLLERGFTEAWGLEAGRSLLARPDPPTAVFCGNDLLAWGLYQACGEVGVRVPDDLSVIGFDDLPRSAQLSPPLTTIRQPLVEMGEEAVRLLLEGWDRDAAARKSILPVELVVRSSTAAPSARHGRT